MATNRMTGRLRAIRLTHITRYLAALAIALAVAASATPVAAQETLVTELPDQNPREGYQGGAVVEAGNGDMVAAYVENGVFTSFPEGTPANLYITRSSDGGMTWSTREVFDTGIPDDGVQGIGRPKLFVLASGDLQLTYWYLGVGFVTVLKSFVSNDNGATWTSAGESSAFGTTSWAITPGGTFVGIESAFGTIVDQLYVATSPDGVNWTRGTFLMDNEFCSPSVYAWSDTDWEVFYTECAFGYGGSTTTHSITSSDAGATWSSPAEIMTSGSGFDTNAQVVAVAGGAAHMLTYIDGVNSSYRTSTDAGATWSDPITWLESDDVMRDVGLVCSPGSAGPVCLFGRNRPGASSQTAHFAQISSGPLSIEYAGDIDESFRLFQNYPNPVRGSTTITFKLGQPARATLKVYNVLGQDVASLVDAVVPAGKHEVSWAAPDNGSGVYFYRLQTETGSATGSMTVVK